MGNYFGSGKGEIAADVAQRVDAIAREHGAALVPYSEPTGPGERSHRYWFEGINNLGDPFDGQVRDSVIAALDAAGLWPIPTVQAPVELVRVLVGSWGSVEEVHILPDGRAAAVMHGYTDSLHTDLSALERHYEIAVSANPNHREVEYPSEKFEFPPLPRRFDIHVAR